MDSQPSPSRRRRGAELEAALLDAAWQELDESGYSALTMEAVAARAGTSRPVIARRWPSRSDLAMAAIRHHLGTDPVDIPDHGSLREDVLDLLRQSNERRSGIAAPLLLRFSGILGEAEGGIAGLRERFLGERPEWMRTLLERAQERGEVDLDRLPPLVVQLPLMLLRHELLLRMAAVDDAMIVSIVDDVFLPLATASVGGADAR
ncbi:TetR/AcrR family transcriptional regulator [Leifsonia sp. F6_8S_P_1B]|uniref:TetR/AcrR family transcriptional regulator n=1 Tax=Leifsonia williamsii TaxID=3035919 RepID=A0ABT8KDM8_9MICO|nr:TetR/AcrR family transcriptional regulator [Leifsonia williamsii]MDN4615578.1 TetR/AcrR family transcriptional regulator [Leifsonia williamsii]